MTTHIVCISGGKDSSCMAKRQNEVEPRNYTGGYIYICTPTGDELPGMEDHWKRLEDHLKAPILKLTDPEYTTIYDLIEHFQMLPNFRARWCSRVLKIEVAQTFYKENLPAKIYVGLRADEEGRKGNKLFDADIDQVFPLREWKFGLHQVWSYLDKNKIEIPRRTDCAMCFWQRIGEWWNLWKDHRERWQRIEWIENSLGHTLMTPGKHKNWPHALRDLRKEFERGRVPRNSDDNMKLFPDQSNGGKCLACTL